ncbi:hypothetical protein GALMADRAFT_234858 [Galerina marginata CBS 339.88]|uniref:Protein kinase domain-containing protein n=1 Tax=Galerina marginata (strain CBS 339.88) TaxID=685588 RepID=A0A067TTX2_GALM3|nr:hypothetical protein GALMADRAFT_234858 [Galerina marginata CBS 339.88]
MASASTPILPPSALPKSLKEWQISGLHDPETDYLAIRKGWKFLEPFFASCGYTLYQPQPAGISLRPASFKSGGGSDVGYPYARRAYTSDKEAEFHASSTRIFPATNASGQDVVIKVIADDTLSYELQIMQYLNTPEARSDPRNHTIPIIEFLEFGKFTFVVMPRWGQAFWPDFGTVNELMHFSQSFLEAFEFLHDNHIVHADFLEQNTAMDVIYCDAKLYSKGLRQLSSTRYALIDFDNSRQYPPNIPIEQIQETRFWNFYLRDLPEPQGAYNPFQVDIISLGLILQRWVRHIEDIVPELGPFFDHMVTNDPEQLFTARQALAKFNNIYHSLSKSQLDEVVINRWWQDGIIKPKLK